MSWLDTVCSWSHIVGVGSDVYDSPLYLLRYNRDHQHVIISGVMFHLHLMSCEQD